MRCAVGEWVSGSELRSVLNKVIERFWGAVNLVGDLAGNDTEFHVTLGGDSTDWALKMDGVENEFILMTVNSGST